VLRGHCKTLCIRTEPVNRCLRFVTSSLQVTTAYVRFADNADYFPIFSFYGLDQDVQAMFQPHPVSGYTRQNPARFSANIARSIQSFAVKSRRRVPKTCLLDGWEPLPQTDSVSYRLQIQRDPLLPYAVMRPGSRYRERPLPLSQPELYYSPW
jgi:hypothetical protein